jgi:regulator of protease activity HflC (stomatin/prohibitin superfamily)
LSERDKVNVKLQDVLDKQTDPWGIKVSLVETKQVDLATKMQRAIARQAEAANIISAYPAAMHLRFLQTLSKVSAEKSSTIILPLPIDLLTAFLQKKEKE